MSETRIPRWKSWPHVIRIQDFTVADLEDLVAHARRFEEALKKRQGLPRLWKPRPAILELLFFEASTRTEHTNWVAGYLLGMGVRDVPNPKVFSSAVKGESLVDAICALTRTGGMGEMRAADCVVIRHGDEGSAQIAADTIDIANGDGSGPKTPLPVINGGDGKGQHPTQAMVDLLTIFCERKISSDRHPLDNLNILFTGDLLRGRTSNSLMYELGRFGFDHKIHITFSTLGGMEPKDEILSYLARRGIDYGSESNFKKALRDADVVYLTRHQKERATPDEPLFSVEERLPFTFEKGDEHLLKEGAVIMHPLPINRNPEDPPPEIDNFFTPLAIKGDPRFAWFRQSHRGVPLRAALNDFIFAGIDSGWERVPQNVSMT